MKINRLKFKQLSKIINKKQLNLQLFNHSDQLFEQSHRTFFNKSTRTINKFDQLKKSRSKTHEKTVNKSCNKQNTNGVKVKDMFYYLEESVLNYLQYLSSEQKKSIKKQMEVILTILKSQNHKSVLSKFKCLQTSLSRKITNRLVHLMFYLIYNKLSNGLQEIQKQIKNYILCEYYSRKFNFKALTLSICVQIQNLFCLINDYGNGRIYARKCLKLAVILNNQYYQNKMIQAFYLLNYYEGRLNENTTKLLSKQERFRIIQNYKQENQIPDIFGLEHHDYQTDQFQEFPLEHNNNFVQNNIPNSNIEYFQTNYHEIIKIMPNKTLNLRNVMKKVSSVGFVKKYFSRDNYITIKPQCHVIKPFNQGQVLITHKKSTVTNSQKIKNIHLFNQRIIKLLSYLISSFTYNI